MALEYREIKDFKTEDLKDLFLSVDWSSGHYPEKLVVALKNSSTVFSAWEDGRLVGLINALDDGIITAYIHYLLVNPEYQKKGIGMELVNRMKEKYKKFLRIVLIAYNKEISFYQHCGFETGNNKTPMFITSLWT
jgi:GNAT superfamily N-acetyltransferase